MDIDREALRQGPLSHLVTGSDILLDEENLIYILTEELLKHHTPVIIEELLRLRLNPNKTTPQGIPALYMQCYHDNISHDDKIKCMSLFLQYNADPNRIVSNQRHTIFTTICQDIDVLKLLIQYKFNVNLLNSIGRSCLYYVNNTSILCLLIENNIDLDSAKRQESYIFGTNMTYECLHILLQCNINPNISNLLHQTMLSYTESSDTAHLFIQYNANPNRKSYNSLTPLMLCKSKSILTLLCDAGAECNIQDYLGRTALHHYRTEAIDPCDDIRMLLLDYKADPLISMHDGTTPLFRAETLPYTKRLIDANVDIYASTSHSNMNAVHSIKDYNTLHYVLDYMYYEQYKKYTICNKNDINTTTTPSYKLSLGNKSNIYTELPSIYPISNDTTTITTTTTKISSSSPSTSLATDDDNILKFISTIQWYEKGSYTPLFLREATPEMLLLYLYYNIDGAYTHPTDHQSFIHNNIGRLLTNIPPIYSCIYYNTLINLNTSTRAYHTYIDTSLPLSLLLQCIYLYTTHDMYYSFSMLPLPLNPTIKPSEYFDTYNIININDYNIDNISEYDNVPYLQLWLLLQYGATLCSDDYIAVNKSMKHHKKDFRLDSNAYSLLYDHIGENMKQIPWSVVDDYFKINYEAYYEIRKEKGI